MTEIAYLKTGRTAVITGGASGIGLAAARRFAGMGMKVVIADLEEGALLKAAATISDGIPGKPEILTVRADVSHREDVDRLKERVQPSAKSASS